MGTGKQIRNAFKTWKDPLIIDEMNCLNVRMGCILLPVIVVLEVLMLILVQNQLSVGKSIYGPVYTGCYIALLLATAVALVAMLAMRCNFPKYRRALIAVTNLYLVAIICRAVAVTYVDLLRGGEITVYLTVLVIFSVAIYIQPWAVVATFGGSALMLILLAMGIDERNAGITINTTAFAAFMVMLSVMRYRGKGTAFCNGNTVKRQNEELSALNERLRVLSQTDQLTGLYNRWYFDDGAPGLMARCAGQKQPIAMIMADIDRFKTINDRYGHKTGDVCIRTVADVFDANVHKAGGVSYRFGGEEFLAIIPDCGRRATLHEVFVKQSVPHRLTGLNAR